LEWKKKKSLSFVRRLDESFSERPNIDQSTYLSHNAVYFASHSTGASAVIRPDSTQVWYFNAKLHRKGDKPAVIHLDGRQE
jgi:hypothetical protein